MKRIVLVSGLIGGAIVALTSVISVTLCYNTGKIEGSMLIGYASMLLAFSMIYVGIKNYRDKQNGGTISFGKAFKIGLLITLVTSTIYVLAWQIEYNFFFPDFGEKYGQYLVDQMKKDGASAADVAAKAKEMKEFAEMYKNPLINIAYTYLEIFPIGLLASLICAAILKRNNRKEVPAMSY